MAYIGVSPQNGVRKKHTYTASGSQTSFTGAGAEGITLSYKDSNFVDVYQNGVKLAEADYTSTSGTAIVLDQGAAANDIVEIIVYDVFSTSDMVSASDGGTFAGNVAMSGTLTLTGNGDFNGDLDVDGTLEADAITVNGTALNTVIAGVTVANATLAATATVTDSNANTNFPIVFHDESNALLDDTGALRYNPSTGELLVPKLTVAGTTTTVDTVTMNAANAVVFEGATADAHETTLTIVDPTADRTINLPNVSGTIPVLAAASNTAITSTPDELNLLDGITAGTVSASLAVVADSNKDITGFRNITTTGVVTSNAGVVVDNITIDGTEIDLSSGNLTLDIDGQLVINSDSGQIVLQDDTVNWGNFQNSSGDFIIGSLGADKDIIFQGLDGSSTITALTLDMSDGGRAAFAHNADFVDGRGIRLGDGNDFQLYHDGTDSYLLNSTGDLIINSAASDEDIIFKGNDGGSTITSLTLDMSAAGMAIFSGGVNLLSSAISFSGSISTPQTAAAIFRPADNNLAFSTANNERMRIDSSGNVGIGTSSPSSPLEVSSSATNSLRIHRDFAANSASSATIRFAGDDDAGNLTDYAEVRSFTENVANGSEAGALILGALSGGSVTEAMRINADSVGGLGHTGGNGAISSEGFVFRKNTNGNHLEIGHASGAGNGFSFLICRHNGSSIGGISQDGTTGVDFDTSSDYRLKENVSYDFDATTRLKKLKPCRFNFIAESDRTVDGFLAHEVEDAVPQAVKGDKDAVDAKGNIVSQMIDHSKLVPLLVKTIQELEARITALENA